MADDKEDVVDSPEIHFEPIVNLPPVEVITLEEEENELLHLRARLFRYDSETEPPEWKERGTGNLKILQHKQRGTCRVLMRREKTLKICANHYVLPHMELKPNCGSDRAWVWSTPADFADEESKSELLAAKFTNAENAQKFKGKFEEAKQLMEERLKSGDLPDSVIKEEKEDGAEDKKSTEDKDQPASEDKSSESVASQLEQLSVKDKTSDSSDTTTVKSTETKTEDQAER